MNDDRRPTDVDALLTRLGERAIDRVGAHRPPTALSKMRARAYDASRRRDRHRRLASAAVLVLVVAVMTPSLLGRGPGSELFTGQGGPGPGTIGTRTPGSGRAPAGTTPGSVPTPVAPEPGEPTDPDAGPRADDGLPEAANPTSPLQVRPDGLGLVHFDQDRDSAMAALTAALGPPDEDSGPASPGDCIRVSQMARWGDLKIWFIELGAGLVLTGYNWGDPNLTSSSLSVAGPGTPPLGNPLGYQVGTTVPSADAVVSRIRRDYPDARRDTGPGVIPYVSAMTGPRVLKISVTEGSKIARILVFDERLITCP